MTEESRPVGAPTKYNPEYCQQVIELGKLGKSITQMACALGVVKQTLYYWEKEHPEFLDACLLARQYSQDWWETVGHNHIIESPGGNKVNSALYARSMACRFPEDWREKSDVNLGGQENNPVNQKTIIEIVKID